MRSTDPEIQEISAITPEDRGIVLDAVGYSLDVTSLASLRKLIIGAESERIKLDAINSWLGHRAKMAELSGMRKLGAASVNVFVGTTDKEDSNVRRVKSAFIRGDGDEQE